MSQEFVEYSEKVKTLSTKPSDDDLLRLYSLYKQVTVGDCNTDKPSFYQLKECAKWNAWNGIKGKAKDDSEKEYIELAKRLISKQ